MLLRFENRTYSLPHSLKSSDTLTKGKSCTVKICRIVWERWCDRGPGRGCGAPQELLAEQSFRCTLPQQLAVRQPSVLQVRRMLGK